MQEMDKEKWIDEVADSARGIQPAVPADALFRKIEQRIAAGAANMRTVPLRTVWVAAACILLLLAANLVLLQGGGGKKPVQQERGVDAVIEYYGLNDDKMTVR